MDNNKTTGNEITNEIADLLAWLMETYWDDPVGFAIDVVQFEPDEWQQDVLNDLASDPKVSVRSGQGVGKTGVESIAALWYLTCRPYPRVVATAPTLQQLNDILWSEIAKWKNRSPLLDILLEWTKTRIYMVGFEDRWFAVARTATRPENMQGFHEDYMLFIADEASGIADNILEAILGTLSGLENKLLMCGNPTRTSGVFFDSQNKDRADYKTHKVSARNSKRTSQENIAMLERKYGKDSDVIRVRVDGEFPKAEADSFIPLEFAELATQSNIAITGSQLHLGVDVARFGDDETVIAPRIGLKVFGLNCYNKQDTMVTAGWVLNIARQYQDSFPQIQEVFIKVDDSGVGGGVTDRLNEVNAEDGLGYYIVPINNGSKSDDEHYDNKGTESWATVRELLEENFSGHMQGNDLEVELPNDDKLISQLTTRKYRMTSKGKIALERKEDMKKRGLQSPDRADAVVLSFATNNGEFQHTAAPLVVGMARK